MALYLFLQLLLADVEDLEVVVDASSEDPVPIHAETHANERVLNLKVFDRLLRPRLPHFNRPIITDTRHKLHGLLGRCDVVNDAAVPLILPDNLKRLL